MNSQRLVQLYKNREAELYNIVYLPGLPTQARDALHLEIARLRHLTNVLEKGNWQNSAGVPAPLWFEIIAERARQDAKWGEQNHDDFTWLAILSEEVGEIAQAALHDVFGGPHAGTLRHELIQAVAVGVQWIECIDRRHK